MPSLTVEPPKSFKELVKVIKGELADKGLDELSQEEIEKLRNIMESYESKEEEWMDNANYDQYRYTRNLVDDGNGKYNLIVMAWNTEQKSPIHDHAGSHCIMKILKGTLLETRFEMPTKEDSVRGRKMRVKEERELHKNQTAYVNGKLEISVALTVSTFIPLLDSIGIHRVANPSKSERAASLHLYTPPIEYCNTFCEDDR